MEGEAQRTAIRFLGDFSADALTLAFLTGGGAFSSANFNGIYFQQLGIAGGCGGMSGGRWGLDWST